MTPYTVGCGQHCEGSEFGDQESKQRETALAAVLLIREGGSCRLRLQAHSVDVTCCHCQARVEDC